MSEPDLRMVLVGVSLAALAACSSGEPSPPLPYAVHEIAGLDAPDAAIAGSLVLEDGCLSVDGYPLSLPSTAEWDADHEAVTIDGIVHPVGNAVAWGGGYVARTEVTDLPAGCGGGEVAKVYTT